MMKQLFSILALSLIASVVQSAAPPEIAIIPQPVTLVVNKGSFTLPENLVIGAPKGQEQLAGMLRQSILVPTGLKVSVTTTVSKPAILFQLNGKPDQLIGKEGYQLDVSANGVLIKANEPAGLFYGMQTLLQLLPKEIESKTKVEARRWSIPFVHIVDYPRFGWRGLMFDVARHFFTPDEVKAFIDNMAKYKFNLLHLHLTDDEGWRIEIKGLPKLTEIGAWNLYRVGGNFGDFTAPEPAAKRNFGGFYTREQMKDIIAYASGRFVNILPEVDVPGHSMAAVAAYPELSGTPGEKKVLSGEKFINWRDPNGEIPGENTLLFDNTLSPASEKTYAFLDKVFGELAEIFPFDYIHMGGDECIKNFWRKNADITTLMQKEGLKNMEEVQSYFVHRVQKIITSKGKKMIGWDEILQGGQAPDAAVMSWRGFEGGTEAAKKGKEVVMSPYTKTYLDLMQGDEAIEAPVYATVRLKDSYSFEPVPDGVDPKYIKGGQANIWTEKIYNTRHLQYMLWPRAFAIAESVWTPKEKKNWNDFTDRVEAHFQRYDQAGIKYATSMYEPVVKVARNPNGEWVVTLFTEANGVALHYSFDSSFPDEHYPKYEAPLVLPADITVLRVVGYKAGKMVGRMMTIPATSLAQRAEIGN